MFDTYLFDIYMYFVFVDDKFIVGLFSGDTALGNMYEVFTYEHMLFLKDSLSTRL